RLLYQCAARGKARQALDRYACALAHHMIECASDQEKEQERDRGVEVGMRSMMDGLVETQPEYQQYADRDRNIHVGATVPQTLPSRAEAAASGIAEGGECDPRGNPVEQDTRFGVGT